MRYRRKICEILNEQRRYPYGMEAALEMMKRHEASRNAGGMGQLCYHRYKQLKLFIIRIWLPFDLRLHQTKGCGCVDKVM